MMPHRRRRNATGDITSSVRSSGHGRFSRYATRPSSVHDSRSCANAGRAPYRHRRSSACDRVRRSPRPRAAKNPRTTRAGAWRRVPRRGRRSARARSLRPPLGPARARRIRRRVVGAGLTREPPRDPARGPIEDREHVGGRQHRDHLEPKLVAVVDKHAVGHDHVIVDVQVDQPTETLAKHDRSGARRAQAARSRDAPLPSADRAHHELTDPARPPRVAREDQAQRLWDGEHPLPVGRPGSTRATRCAAVSDMRRAVQLGQMPRHLHENATTISSRHAWQRTRAKPWASTPQRKYAASSRST